MVSGNSRELSALPTGVLTLAGILVGGVLYGKKEEP